MSQAEKWNIFYTVHRLCNEQNMNQLHVYMSLHATHTRFGYHR